MEDINDCINELHLQICKGNIQKGYKAILEYILSFQSYLKKNHKNYSFPGTFYHGYMDMSYFAVIPSSFEGKGLKIAIVFNFKAFRFEIWLSGYNKEIQKKYLDLFKENKLEGYFIPDTIKGYDSIVEDHVDIDGFDREKVTLTLETRLETFVKIIESIITSV